MAKKIISTDDKSFFSLIGIISNSSDVKIAWNINNILNIKLSKFNFENAFISNFSFFVNKSNPKIILIENKANSTFLFSDLKKFEFILKIYLSESDFTVLYNKLKTNAEFHSIFKIDLTLLSKKSLQLLNTIDFEI